MSAFWVGAIVGGIIGALVGCLAMALAIAASRAERALDAMQDGRSVQAMQTLAEMRREFDRVPRGEW